MQNRDSAAVDRAETRAAKETQRLQDAATVWADVEADRQAIEARTERLQAARLARDTAPPKQRLVRRGG